MTRRFQIALAFCAVLIMAIGVTYSYATGYLLSYEISNLIDTRVVSPRGEKVGEIENFIIGDGKIHFAIISRSGFLGMGKDEKTIPFEILTYGPQGKAFVLNITEEKWEVTPDYDKKRLHDRTWVEDVYRFFGMPPSWKEGLHEIDELLGTDVKNLEGKDVGEIDDFIIVSDGRISFAILSHDRGALRRDKPVAIPYGALTLMAPEEYFVLDASTEKLRAAPDYHPLALGDRKWAESLYRYFGQQPFWTD